jgi:hypothetical protein
MIGRVPRYRNYSVLISVSERVNVRESRSGWRISKIYLGRSATGRGHYRNRHRGLGKRRIRFNALSIHWSEIGIAVEDEIDICMDKCERLNSWGQYWHAGH